MISAVVAKLINANVLLVISVLVNHVYAMFLAQNVRTRNTKDIRAYVIGTTQIMNPYHLLGVITGEDQHSTLREALQARVLIVAILTVGVRKNVKIVIFHFITVSVFMVHTLDLVLVKGVILTHVCVRKFMQMRMMMMMKRKMRRLMLNRMVHWRLIDCLLVTNVVMIHANVI